MGERSGGPTGEGGSASLRYGDPFADAPEERSPVRRLRGRLVAPVSVWTAFGPGGEPAGLTVSSMLVCEGDPALLLGLLDPLSALAEAIGHSGRLCAHVLAAGDERVAGLFAGAYPAGPFDELGWSAGPHGPVLDLARTRASCEVVSARPLGWYTLVEAEIASVELVEPPAGPLTLHRGRLGPLR